MAENQVDKEKAKLSEKEITDKLHDLNLTTLASERESKLKWFRDHKIKILQIETYYYLLPDAEEAEEILQHIHQANIFVQSLSIHLDWLREHYIVVRLKTEPKGARREYVFVGKKQEEKSEKKSNENEKSGASK